MHSRNTKKTATRMDTNLAFFSSKRIKSTACNSLTKKPSTRVACTLYIPSVQRKNNNDNLTFYVFSYKSLFYYEIKPKIYENNHQSRRETREKQIVCASMALSSVAIFLCKTSAGCLLH